MTEGEIQLTLIEVSMAYGVSTDSIVELVLEGVLDPLGGKPEEWRFDEVLFRHAGIAVRLQRDLGINLPGVALALQLLDELQDLRQRQASGG